MSDERPLVIIGAGPAGLAAAIQAARDGLLPVLVGDEAAGGLLLSAYRLDNLPGFPAGIAGDELAGRLTQQAAAFGVSPLAATVTRLENPPGHFLVHLVRTDTQKADTLRAQAIIVATGTRANAFPWTLPEAHPGLHRDARSLPADLKGARVAVIGGGEAALDSALSAARRGAQAKVFARSDAFRAPERLIAEARDAGVLLQTGSRLDSAHADGKHLILQLFQTDGATEQEVDHLVIAIGREARRDLLAAFAGLQSCDSVQSPVAGLFLAGDIIRGRNRFAAIALGDGMLAACLARDYLTAKRQALSTDSTGRRTL